MVLIKSTVLISALFVAQSLTVHKAIILHSTLNYIVRRKNVLRVKKYSYYENDLMDNFRMNELIVENYTNFHILIIGIDIQATYLKC